VITVKLLNERVAVITGSTKGNGRAIANLYSEQGANVVVTGRSPSELKIHAGSVEPRTKSVLKVGSYCRNNNLSFKGFQVP
jgi:NAD(P)-dependent dehydrogenase (short-subunit alcohol dehydrogenase family)